MPLTPEQVKGRIKNLAKDSNADARILLRIYMMERLLERVSISNFVTALVGVTLRSTMDIEICTDNPCIYAGAECTIHLTLFFQTFHTASCMNLSSYATINTCRRRTVTGSIQQQNKLS